MCSKPKRRRIWPALPPRGLRPKLAADQVRDLALAHLTNLDLMVRGQADEDLMWQLAEQTLTWSRVAQITGHLQDEMHTQLMVVANVVRRFGRTGKVGFTGTEYQAAKAGIEVMDALAEVVELHQAKEAALWSELAILQLRDTRDLAVAVEAAMPLPASGITGPNGAMSGGAHHEHA